MEFVDTHCHIQSAGISAGEQTTAELWAKSPELTADQMIQNATAAQVTKMICVGCNLADSKLALDFAATRKNCWASIGIHPHEAQNHTAENIKRQFSHLSEDSLRKKKLVAIGECGLDYFYNYSPRAAQIELLRFQIELAITHNLPLIFHVREAFDDFWPVFDEYKNIRGVIHSFSAGRKELDEIVGRNLYIGLNGIITFTKQPEQLAAAAAVPLEKLVLESDAPFLTPAPYRGTVNESKYVRVTAKFLAQLRGERLEQLAAATTQNACKLFGLE